MSSNIAFGGKAIILLSDFKRIPPVVPHGSRARTAASSFQRSSIFSPLDVFRLSKTMMLFCSLAEPWKWWGSVSVFKFLVNVGNESHLQTKSCKILFTSFTIRKDSFHEISCAVFPEHEPNSQNFVWLILRAFITTKNIFLRDFSLAVMHRFPGYERKFLSCNSVETEEKEDIEEIHSLYLIQFLNKVTPGSALTDIVIKL